MPLHRLSRARVAPVRHLLAAPLLLLAACGQDAAPPGGPGGQGARPAPQVAVETVTPRPAERTVTLPGRVAASRVALVRPQVDGIITERMFTEGSMVEADDALYQIDPAPYQAAFDQAAAELDRAQSAIEAAEARQERFKGLVERGGVSRQDFDDAEASAASAKADVGVARAARDSARIALDRTTIAAPISGRIGRSTVTEGALVTARQTEPLATITALDPVFVDVTRPSADMLAMRRAQAENEGEAAVTLTLEDGSRYPIEGRLTLSEVEVDPSSGSVTLRAVFPNPDGVLLPGMFVRATIDEGTDPDAILVPQAAVSRTPDGQGRVFVLSEENEAVARAVTTERAVGRDWIVTGLEPGERVILDGFQRFGAGDTVVPQGSGQMAVGDGNGASSVAGTQ